ncbi:MAG: DUF2505 domain-containing protein [Cellvibrionales bacterium]|nr:DUF2505 domain-containing protein [Cellvibrionales bacterium]HRF88406.1 DUF2505 domain-containing protein [Pseudomonadales bacterium]
MSITHHFSQDADAVFAAMTNSDWLIQRCSDLGEKNIACTVEEKGRKTAVQLTRTVKRDLPKVLAAMFNAENTLRMNEQWEVVGSTYMGTYSVEVQGQPVNLSARFKLKPAADGGCEYSIDYQCKAAIPLVGKKVEEFIISQTANGLAQEIDWLKKKLSGT